MLSFLVLNHRRKLRLPEASSYRFRPDWALVLVLRLACLLNRVRTDQRQPPIRLHRARQGWTVDVPADWLAAHPLVEEDLRAENEFLADSGLGLRLRRVR
jgi:exopolyphosphatase/guanosine-5'-triphosphate,3'-diphosphate pyrophosphatase